MEENSNDYQNESFKRLGLISLVLALISICSFSMFLFFSESPFFIFFKIVPVFSGIGIISGLLTMKHSRKSGISGIILNTFIIIIWLLIVIMVVTLSD